MTITQAIPKKAEVTYSDRQISEEFAEAWRRVHITAWEFEGNIRPTNWTEGYRRVELRTSSIVGVGVRRDVIRKARAPVEQPWRTRTAITLGSKYFSYVRSPAPSHTQTLSYPFRNLTNKLRGKIFYKEVFLRLSACVVYYCVFIIVRLFNHLLCRYDAAWTCICVYKHIYYVSIYHYIINVLRKGVNIF